MSGRHRGPHDWPGVVAFTLATGVTVFLVVAAIAVSVQDQPLTDGAAALLSTALGAVVGAVATYLGTARKDPPADLEDAPPPMYGGGPDPEA